MPRLHKQYEPLMVTGLSLCPYDGIGEFDYGLYPHYLTMSWEDINRNGLAWAVRKAYRFRRYAKRMNRQPKHRIVYVQADSVFKVSPMMKLVEL